MGISLWATTDSRRPRLGVEYCLSDAILPSQDTGAASGVCIPRANHAIQLAPDKDDKSIANLIYILGYLSQLDPSLGVEGDEFEDGEEGDGQHATRRLPRPRANGPVKDGPVYAREDTLVVDFDKSPLIWQFSSNFHRDYVYAIANELPRLLNLLQQLPSRNNNAHALKTVKGRFDKWKQSLEEATTIRELDRTINAHTGFEQMIDNFIMTAKQQRSGRRPMTMWRTKGTRRKSDGPGRRRFFFVTM